MWLVAYDPKLSDRRSGRGTCRWVERRRWSAAGAVTAEPVRGMKEGESAICESSEKKMGPWRKVNFYEKIPTPHQD